MQVIKGSHEVFWISSGHVLECPLCLCTSCNLIMWLFWLWSTRRKFLSVEVIHPVQHDPELLTLGENVPTYRVMKCNFSVWTVENISAFFFKSDVGTRMFYCILAFWLVLIVSPSGGYRHQLRWTNQESTRHPTSHIQVGKEPMRNIRITIIYCIY